MESVVVELSAKPSRIEAFLKLLRPYGILEASRSGMMAFPRNAVIGSEMEDGIQDGCEEERKRSSHIVDATMLPPG
jgi:acetolactate synthase-1/3 small subunit